LSQESSASLIFDQPTTPSETNMPKTSKPYDTPDAESPEWTREMFARAKRGRDIPEIKRLLDSMQQEPAREESSDTLHLAPDVVAALRATGPDWQQRAEETLREKFVNKAA
jgi:uncharacterized protein (DUF4415 family)